MSRNKIILLVVAIIAFYFFLPSTGTGGVIKANMLAVAPYVLFFIIVWLLITINMLKRALTRLNENINEENAIKSAKMLNVTFDVKRFIGEGNLIDLYNRVNIASDITIGTKHLLYNAMKRKRIDIPLPSEGKREAANPNKGRPNPNKKKRKK